MGYRLFIQGAKVYFQDPASTDGAIQIYGVGGKGTQVYIICPLLSLRHLFI